MTHLPIEAFRTNREGRLGDIAATYVLALLRGDAGTAERAIRDAMATTLSTAEIDEEIITPAMWMVGRLWEEGQISVADEHLAAEITLRALDLMRRVRLNRPVAVDQSATREGHRILLATAPGDSHVIALRMVDELLCEAGYEVVMLGADVPASDLAQAAVRHEPTVIGISTTTSASAARVPSTLSVVRRRWPSAEWMVGGQGLRGWARSQIGITVCRSVSEAVAAVDAAVQRAAGQRAGRS